MNGNLQKLTLLALSFGLVLTMLLTPTAVFAQAISGNIVGTVSDSSGAVVTNASVEATNLGTGVTIAARTGATG